MTWRTTLLWPDTHVPDQHKKAVDNLLDFVAEYQPDEVVFLGDHLDVKAPARWSRGMADEYAESLAREFDVWEREVAMPLREVYEGPVKAHDGNHPARIQTYVSKYAPAFNPLLSAGKALSLESLLKYDDYEIQRLGTFYDAAPGWVTTHGDKGTSLSQTAGGTALRLAKKVGKSVACGHTHRLGLVPESFGLLGKIYTLHGFEVGHVMDIRKADYLGTGAANWQMGFGLLHTDGKRTFPERVEMTANGGFRIAGHSFGL